MPATPEAIARRLSYSAAGLLNCTAEHTAPGVRREGGWYYGKFHARSVRSLLSKGLIIANPDRALVEYATRPSVVGHSVDGPIVEPRHVTVYRDPKTGDEIERWNADTEEHVLTERGHEVLAALHADSTRFCRPFEGAECMIPRKRSEYGVARV